MNPRTSRLAVAGLALVLSLAASSATYEKIEYSIPMRDGRKLYTSVYVATDVPGTHPILLQRTPYGAGPYGPDRRRTFFGGSRKFHESGYVFAYQDVRGRYMSEGDFVDMRPPILTPARPHDIDESTDTFDTIEFLIRNVPNNNGRVGIWGISYPGGYAAMGAMRSHPALKAASPQAPTSDWFIGDDFHHNGALFLQDAMSFYAFFGQPRPEPTETYGRGYRFDIGGDAYKFFLELGPLSNVNERHFKGEVQFWNDAMRHGTYDEFWQSRSVPNNMRDVKCAVLTVGGWFDAEDLWGPLAVYRATGAQNPGIVNMLVMGPWGHGGWAGGQGDRLGQVRFGQATSEFYREEIEFPFFDAFLRGDGTTDLAKVHVFATGLNQWHKYAQWPPPGMRERSFYFDAGGRLAETKPAQGGSEEYVSDPDAPVPYEGGTLRGRSRTYMIADQRFAFERDDVVSYASPALADDLTVAGPVHADLFITTTGTDADFIVKLIDVYPDDHPDLPGFQQLVRAEVMRAKFRLSFSNPSPLVPGKVEEVAYALPDVFHTFRKGHRLMVQVQSSWFPLVDRNPNQFLDIYSAKAEDYVQATIQIHRGGESASRVRFGTLDRPQ